MSYKPPSQTIVDNDVKNFPSSEAIFEALKLKLDEPSVSGTAGQLLQLDGYVSGEPVMSWVNPPSSALPSQTSNSEKVLATDGSTAYWAIEGVKTGYPTDTVIVGRAKPTGLTGTGNILIGQAGAALTSGARNVFIGLSTTANSITAGLENIIIGEQAANGRTTGNYSVIIGSYSGVSSTGSNFLVALGHRAGEGMTGVDTVCVGRSAGRNVGNTPSCVYLGDQTGTANAAFNATGTGVGRIALGAGSAAGLNCLSVGSSAASINKVVFGKGQFDVSNTAGMANTAVTITTTSPRAGWTNVDTSSGTITIAGAQGTGTGAGGDVIIATAPPAVSSGSSLNAHVEVMRVTDDGLVGIGTTTPSEKLEVAGAVLATEYLVPNYRLDPHTHDEGTETTDFTINWANGAVHTVTLNAAGPLVITMSNPVNGGAYALRIIQGATPGTVTWPANVKWPGGTPPTLSTNTGDIDVVNLLYFDDGGGNTFYYATSALAFA